MLKRIIIPVDPQLRARVEEWAHENNLDTYDFKTTAPGRISFVAIDGAASGGWCGDLYAEKDSVVDSRSGDRWKLPAAPQ